MYEVGRNVEKFIASRGLKSNLGDIVTDYNVIAGINFSKEPNRFSSLENHNPDDNAYKGPPCWQRDGNSK